MDTKQQTMAACLLVISLLISGCGLGQSAWPSGTGYATPAAQRPASPYQILTQETDWEIYGGLNDEYIGNGQVEYGFDKNRNGKYTSFAVAPGAVVTNRTKSQTALTLTDYNGDECIIPYGMTVRIDEYGQYVPVKYDPKLSPAPTK